jgi:cyclic beta-1,2-glucan synthetase
VGVSPWVALGLVLAAFAAGPLMGAVAGFLPSRSDLAWGYFLRAATRDVGRALGVGLFHLAQLLQHTRMAVDAIVRALYRMGVSRRHLLQWTTAAAAQAAASVDLRAVARGHVSEPVLALGVCAALLLAGTPHPVLSAALCLLWSVAPLTTWWVSRPRPARTDAALPHAEQVRLEAIARDTWRLFERVIGPEDRFLPPDNLQTLPHDMVAHRTSPTNIGLYLLSAACAHRFGWIGTLDLVTRLEATLATLATLERHRGHFLNWYDTETGAPLLPMYVSTVDSGNLSGHLLAVAQACLALAETEAPDTAQRLRTLAATCEPLAWEADFSFLYHRKRHLLHIGYRVTEQQLDAGFYDLLASESRLTSLLAIAKGDVPVGHWAALGRPFYAVGAHAGLRSWSGSMFEYLMPSLVLDEPHGSVLREACHGALREQIDFATATGQAVPWGISESAYAGRDHTLAYQYAPQGVPRLALRRTPPGELVIAPYATALAAQIAPLRAAANFRALEALGARGALGFLEALDFSPSRQGDGATFTPVSTFMAHHQGMTIVALANVLLGGVAQRWGMANAHIEAVDSLLHERAPREVPVLMAPPAGPPLQALERRAPGLLREVVPGVAAVEPTHVLSNGRYNVSLRPNGAGWSRWGATGITRWRDDALRDSHGSFFYLRWDRQPTPVSLTQHPAPDPAAHYHSIFHADRVCLDARWSELQAHTTVWVSPEDDIEFRQVALHNLSDRTIEVELLSAFDITLSDARADEAHPAFTNLFVRAEWQASQQALVFARQPRLPTEHGLQMAHFLADTDPQLTEVRLQTDRQRWLGRNRAVGDPLAAFDAAPVAAEDARVRLDTGLDPVCALAVRLRLAPRSVSQLTFATAASDNGGTLHAVIDKYRQPSHVKRASLMSATLTGIRLRALRISPEHFAAVQLLSTALLFSLTRPPTRMVALEDLGVCDRRLLWRFGLSGERPLVLVQVGTVQDLGLLRSLAQALRLWSWGEMACDLVVVNAEPASYLMPLQREIQILRERHAADSAAERRLAGPATTALHALRADELSADELSTLKTLARVRFHGDGRPLLHHVQAWSAWHEQALAARQEVSTTVIATALVPMQAERTVGVFDAATGDFRFPVGVGRRPARPWLNVLSNPDFGAQVSEAGGGYTWAVNSRMNQLTAWSNDPVADPPSEWFLLQDCQTLQVWSVTPSAWGLASGDYQVAHGQGLSVVRHRRGDLAVTAAWCVDAETAVKQVRLHLVNHGTRPLQLRVVGLAEWLMGANRSDRSTVHTAHVRQRLPTQRLTALMATQRERAGGFGAGTAFLALASAGVHGEGEGDGHSPAEDWTCDRRECFDARGRPVLPDHFGRQQGMGFDPCAALSSRLTLGAGAQAERVFLLGYAQSPTAARRIATVAATKTATQRVDEVRQRWDQLLGATTVQTPDPLFDALVNRWLLYQTVSCRLWAKAGFYQAGGATGFRDQLQDAMALAWAAPEMLRDQIVLCASRQFTEGDVQHWWHAPQGAGVRTHFSDDLLWLPCACVHYLRATGDTTVLDQPVAFLIGAPIPEGAEDAYTTPTPSDETAPVYEHAARAIDRSLRVGVHGLPLMGSGDWNDGMNRVGIAGRGESVWLGWFLCKLVADFAPLARARGDAARVQRWEHAAQGWTLALLGPAWDGAWFKRAFFDDGTALGAQANPEARIDLIAQAWAVLSTVAPPTWQHLALAAVDTHLVDHDAGLIRLLDPPLAHAAPSAGYIQAYPPGVRENGGQYSHAGVWALMAEAQAEHPHPPAPGVAGAGDTVYRYFTYLSPAHRAAHPTRGAVYGIEPYVVAGDVYSQPPYVGRGGWSWYTGAAAWLHRAAIESMFGLHTDAQGLRFTPCLPAHWPRAEITLRREGRMLHCRLVRATAAQVVLSPDERLLRPGERLDWTGLAGDCRCVVPLLADAVA